MLGKVKGKTYDEHKERFDFIDEFLSKVKKKRREGKELDREILERAVAMKQERVQLERILRCWNSTLDFMLEYFSDDLNPENEGNLIPAGFSMEDVPEFHDELTNYLDVFTEEDPLKRLAWSVPRSHAKSTYLSNMFPIFSIVFHTRSFIVIISETEAGSRMFTEYVSQQLRENEKLIEDFGREMHIKPNDNIKDNNEEFITLSNIKVKSASTQKQLRGTRHLSKRPDLIIADDLESSKNTNTYELRQKNLHWWNSVVNPMGDPETTAFIYMGTMVHPDGLLTQVMNRPDFESARYSAIVSEPERPDLWEEFERIYRDQENPDRKTDAENYYFENQSEMDRGVKTLWESRFPYYKLIQEKVHVGSKAFNSEYLNLPYDSENAIFKPQDMVYYDESDLFDQYGRPLPLDIYGFLDPSITGTGDYSAIITVGRDRRTGIFYVLDAWAERCNMHVALDMAEKKIMEYEHHSFGVETVQAQWSIFKQLQQNLSRQGYFKTRLRSVKPKGRKEQRIETLEPIIEQGALRFKKHQRLLLEQLEMFPNGDFDDLPDALQQSVELAGNKRKRTFMNKPTGW